MTVGCAIVECIVRKGRICVFILRIQPIHISVKAEYLSLLEFQ